MGICHYNHRSYNLALTCLEGAVKVRSRLKSTTDLASIYGEECALAADFYNLGNVHMQMGDYGQAMQCFIRSRDLRWCHVGSGTVEKILDKYFSSSMIDEDELLGLGEIHEAVDFLFFVKNAITILPVYSISPLSSQYWSHVRHQKGICQFTTTL